MKYIIGAIVVIAIVVIGLYVIPLTPSDHDPSDPSASTYEQYTDRDTGFQFSYRVNPDGYVLEERLPSENFDPFVKSVILMLADEYAALQEAIERGDAREGPPAISVTILKNTQKQRPLAWAEANQQYSNINLKMGDVSEEPVAGALAVRYKADGLYPSDTVVITHGEYVYVVSGQYLEEGTTIHQDFQPFLNSLQFIPTDEQITSFEECAAAGYPVMESYPRQCRTSDGQHFVEDVPLNEANLEVN